MFVVIYIGLVIENGTKDSEKKVRLGSWGVRELQQTLNPHDGAYALGA